ncbi:hypothetical protein HDU93_001629 [Gonapodya sp. JEL0774]|nr:hypothetical protein HDU93_001629 [Gonapodya sp. JEL0774]
MDAKKSAIMAHFSSQSARPSNTKYLPLSTVGNPAERISVANMITGTTRSQVGLLENAASMASIDGRQEDEKTRKRARMGLGIAAVVCLWVLLAALGYSSMRKKTTSGSHMEPAQGSNGQATARPSPSPVSEIDQKQKFDLGTPDPGLANADDDVTQPSPVPAPIDYSPNPNVVGAGVISSGKLRRSEAVPEVGTVETGAENAVDEQPFDSVRFGPKYVAASSHVVY